MLLLPYTYSYYQVLALTHIYYDILNTVTVRCTFVGIFQDKLLAKLDDSDLEHTQAAEEEVSQAYSHIKQLWLLFGVNTMI